MQLSVEDLLTYNLFFCQWPPWVLCRLVCVVPGAMMYKDIYVCIAHGAQLMRLLEQNFPSAPESLLQQFLGAPSSGCVALRHTRRTDFNKEIC